jgi:hypothetical protein
VLNLFQRQIEVYRNPTADAIAPFGWRYADPIVFKPGEAVAPLAKPQQAIDVARLLP